MRALVFVLAVGFYLACPYVDGSGATRHGDGCPCPEINEGWASYPDTASAPDFLRKRSLEVHEIILCDRSAHLLFRARQEGKQRDVCLVIAEPTFDQLLQRLPPDSLPNDSDLVRIDQELVYQRAIFSERMQAFRGVLSWPDHGNQHAIFRTGWFGHPPKIYPRKPLVVGWKEREVSLVGTIDIYFSR